MPRHTRRVVVPAALAMLGACGSIPYTPVEMLTSPPENGSNAPTIDVKVGPEWLEIGVRNTTGREIDVDWSRTAFITGSGTYHRLLPTAVLNELRTVRRGQASDLSWLVTNASSLLPYGMESLALGRHADPPPIGAADVVRLKPGESIVQVLYPAAHVQVHGPSGETQVTPLFCDSAAAGARMFSVQVAIDDGVSLRTEDIVLRTVGGAHSHAAR